MSECFFYVNEFSFDLKFQVYAFALKSQVVFNNFNQII